MSRSPRWFFVLSVLLASGCDRPASEQQAQAQAHTAPASVAQPRPESDLARVHLTPAAVQRIGVESTAVEARELPRWRVLGGVVVAPPGARIDVTAPVVGRVLEPLEGSYPSVLTRVAAGQSLAVLEPSLSADREVRSGPELLDEDLKRVGVVVQRQDGEAARVRAEIRLEAAVLALERAERVARGDVGTQRRVDEARVERDLAAAELAAAERRLEVLPEELRADGTESPESLDLVAPRAGLVEQVFAVPRQVVPAGARLLTLLDDGELWLRVPVPVAELSTIDGDAPARVEELEGRGGASAAALELAPVAGPAQGDPSAGTVDLFFAVGAGARLGERRVVRLLQRGSSAARTVVPWTAVVFDYHGGAWVYVDESGGTYRRARVVVARREGELAVLASGPELGVQVVSVGAAELFGTEFGNGK